MPPDLTKKTPEWTLTKAAKAAIPEWNRKWERIILSTDEIDFDRTASAVRCMYAAAKLAEPVIVRCLSPMQGTIVCAWAAAFWYVVGKAGSATRSAIYSATDSATRSATRSATYSATDSATYSATDSATYSATDSATRSATDSAIYSATDSATYSATDSATYSAIYSATYLATRSAIYSATDSATRSATDSATDSATRSATRSATDSATDSATRSATDSATDSATYSAIYSATDSATYSATDSATYSATRSATRSATDASLKSVPQTMWEAARSVVRSKLNDAAFRQAEAIAKNNLPRWWDFYNGGSEWASWCAFLSFPRDICGWKSPTHANYAHYENAAIHGGGRFMHTHFCLLCDRPITRKTRLVSAVHQLHCEDGPSIEWRCGTRAWHLGGVAATEKVVMRPHELTPADIHSVQDEELRSAMLERYPWPRYLGDVGATCIDEGPNEIEGTYEALFDAPQVGQRRMVATCATGHIVSLGVPSTVSTLGEARRYLSPFGNKTRIVART